MKAFFGILAAIAFVLLLIFVAPIISEFIGRKHVSEMTPEKAHILFEQAGGINEVNRETRDLFDKLGTNKWFFLYPTDLTNSPAVYFLYTNLLCYSGKEYSGTRVAIWPEHGRHLEIRYGNHYAGKEILIFDPTSTNKWDKPSDWYPAPWIQISSNIFVSK